MAKSLKSNNLRSVSIGETSVKLSNTADSRGIGMLGFSLKRRIGREYELLEGPEGGDNLQEIIPIDLRKGWIMDACISTLAWALIAILLICGMIIEMSVVKVTTIEDDTYGSDHPLIALPIQPTLIRSYVAQGTVMCFGLFLADQLMIKPIWKNWKEIAQHLPKVSNLKKIK